NCRSLEDLSANNLTGLENGEGLAASRAYPAVRSRQSDLWIRNAGGKSRTSIIARWSAPLKSAPRLSRGPAVETVLYNRKWSRCWNERSKPGPSWKHPPKSHALLLLSHRIQQHRAHSYLRIQLGCDCCNRSCRIQSQLRHVGIHQRRCVLS